MHDWQITWNGATYRRDDLTVAHARVVSELIGDDTWAWVDLDPTKGPLAFLAVLVAFVAVDEGLSATDTLRLVEQFGSTPLATLLAAFEPITD